MNTITQQQMTTERKAPGMSLLASQLLASLLRSAASLFDRASYQRRTKHAQHPQPIHRFFDGNRCEHAQHHIRGGNP
ncbi:MAG: hypothetical protein V4631_13420 [Pseudomonadota bacterium]